MVNQWRIILCVPTRDITHYRRLNHHRTNPFCRRGIFAIIYHRYVDNEFIRYYLQSDQQNERAPRSLIKLSASETQFTGREGVCMVVIIVNLFLPIRIVL